MGWSGQPHVPAASTPGKDPVPIVQEAGWAPGSVWTGGKSRPQRNSIVDRPARSQSLHRLSYPAHAKCLSEGKSFTQKLLKAKKQILYLRYIFRYVLRFYK